MRLVVAFEVHTRKYNSEINHGCNLKARAVAACYFAISWVKNIHPIPPHIQLIIISSYIIIEPRDSRKRQYEGQADKL